MADDQWYYAQAGQRLGPVATQTIQGMAAAGTLGPQDFVWRDGMTDWQPAASIPGLLLHPAPQSTAPLGYAGAMPVNYYTPPQQYAPYAGFWLRFVALIIDGVLLVVVNNVLGYCVGYAIGMSMARSGSSREQIIMTAQLAGGVVGIAVDWLYYALMESSANQATLGKMALGIKVTDMAGSRISFGRATGRYFAKSLSFLILGIGYLMAAFSEKKQALHDSMSACLVVRKS